MKVTDVQVRLTEDPGAKLKAYCRVTFDDALVVHDIKIIDSSAGRFIAMPSRRLMERCPRCKGKNHLLARFCNNCGSKLPLDPKPRDTARLHADIVHPINAESRQAIESVILAEYEAVCRAVAPRPRKRRPPSATERELEAES